MTIILSSQFINLETYNLQNNYWGNNRGYTGKNGEELYTYILQSVTCNKPLRLLKKLASLPDFVNMSLSESNREDKRDNCLNTIRIGKSWDTTRVTTPTNVREAVRKLKTYQKSYFGSNQTFNLTARYIDYTRVPKYETMELERVAMKIIINPFNKKSFIGYKVKVPIERIYDTKVIEFDNGVPKIPSHIRNIEAILMSDPILF